MLVGKNKSRLRLWQERYEKAKGSYQKELEKMDWREKLNDGTKEIAPVRDGKPAKKATHVWNITAELVESQVSSAIPMPKVTAVREEDEYLAQKIENWIRNELDRLPMEELNDQDERTTYIQGGDHFLCEWDTTKRTHSTQGAIEINLQHPKTVIPQPGVLTGIEDMDYIFVCSSRTKKWIFDTYGENVDDAEESTPQIRAVTDAPDSEDLVTQIYAFWRNEDGGIGLYSWVDGTDIELCDMEDYLARQIHVCEKCGAPGDGVHCVYCGGTKFSQKRETLNDGTEIEGRIVTEPIRLSDGRIIAPYEQARDEDGMPMTIPEVNREVGYLEQVPAMVQTVIPYYKPNVYPIVLRKNVSQFGRYLGGSDVDKIMDQQETIKMLSTKAKEKVLKGGSVFAKPANLAVKTTDEEQKVVDVSNPADLQKMGVFNLQVDTSADIAMKNMSYEEARGTLGITDSFQGKRDSTATSGTAKQFAAAQSAGRLESKRVMKDAAYARLFETMFKFALAYMDEPREIVYTDGRGGKGHDTFNPYDFLRKDAVGEWYWNDQFLFSVDSSASLINNREALWQETRMNYQSGCYGPVGAPESLYYFWRIMERHHYPGAGEMVQIFREKVGQMQAMTPQPGNTPTPGSMEEIAMNAAAQIAQNDAQAQQSAMLQNGGGRI